MKYVVHNKTTFNIQLIVPHPKRDSFQLTIAPSCSVNILPWAGSVAACKRIAHIHDLEVRGWVNVIEEE